MAEEPIKKRVDESWKEEVKKQQPKEETPGPKSTPKQEPKVPAEDQPKAASGEPQFNVFISSLSMQAMMMLGEIPLPGSNEKRVELEQARYLIDTLGLLQEKTQGNLNDEETKLLENVLYELRMRYSDKVQAQADAAKEGLKDK